MPSPRRVKKSVQKTRKSTKKNLKKSVQKTRKSTKKNLKKSVKTKRSYGFGVKVSEGGNTFDARDWQERAFDQYLGSLRNMSQYTDDIPLDYLVTIGGYKVFFNSDANGISYHPAKTVQKIITEEVPDKSRTIRIYKDISAQKPFVNDDTELSAQPWKCVKPYNKQYADTKDRLQSCSESGPAKKGYEKKGGSNRQECIENCHM